MYHRYSFAEATGKTELWRTLAHLNTRTGLDTTYQRVSPKTMDLVELFGRINPKTKEWQDGVPAPILAARLIHVGIDPIPSVLHNSSAK